MSPANSSTKLHDIGIKPKFGIISWELPVNGKKLSLIQMWNFHTGRQQLFSKFSQLKTFYIYFIYILYSNSNPVHKAIFHIESFETVEINKYINKLNK